MKDPMFDNLAERFADHAVDVAPGTWNAISGKLALANGSSLSALLQEKFEGHEAHVDPQVWTNISSQLGHGAAAGVGSTAGWWAAGIAATLVAGSVLLYTMNSEPTAPALAEKTPVVAPVPTGTAPVNAQPSTAGVPSVVPSEQATTPAQTVAAPVATRTQATATNRPVENKEHPTKNEAATGHGDAATEKPLPAPTEEGQQTVTTVLQDIVDNYVTSPEVVAHEKKAIPPPAQSEMPSEAVRPYGDEPEAEVVPEPEPAFVQPELEVFIPTAFSPNGDFVNDELAVSIKNYQKADVRIFSATNDRLVFKADNLEAKWNGLVMNTGERCEPGMYFYALEVTDAQGRTWSKGEVVRLFR